MAKFSTRSKSSRVRRLLRATHAAIPPSKRPKIALRFPPLFLMTVALATAIALASGAPASAIAQETSVNTDRAALVALYNATDGPNWRDCAWNGCQKPANWLSNKPIGEWSGVSTDANGRVRSLDLRSNGLRGELPAELGNLSELGYLVLNSNGLSGNIPAELGNLDKLWWLDLRNNGLSGSIPAELGNLSELTTLNIHRNQLSGSIPAELGSLSNLGTLALDNNQLSGSIPAELGSLSNLGTLALDNNQLSGSIPAELGSLSNLGVLGLGNNQLSGSIPAELGNLSELTTLDLHRNQLSGSIPAELGNLSELESLYLGGRYTATRSIYIMPSEPPSARNQLSGSIPAELGNLSNLEIMHLGRNQLSGSIPAELGKLSSLEQLYLYENQLSGSIPAELGNLSNLEHLYLGDNRLSGSIPAELGNLSKLKHLSLGDDALFDTNWAYRTHNANELSGSIPAELGNLSNLALLHLAHNKLSGAIPSELGNLSKLEWLWASYNELTGSVPTEVRNLPSLTFLTFHRNRLNDFSDQAPVVTAAIGDVIIVNEIRAQEIPLSEVFSDADNDALYFNFGSSDEAVVTVSGPTDGSRLTLDAQAKGTATVTVTAYDRHVFANVHGVEAHGLESDTFTVTVKATPVVASTITDVSGLDEGSTRDISLSGVFSDADGDSLTITAASSNDATATVSVAAGYSSLTISGKAEGTTTISVTARDSDGNSVSDAFDVTVVKVNNPPTVASSISDVTITNETGTNQVSLSGVFNDADADDLTITAASSDKSVATASVSTDHSSLTVTAKRRGTATVTVTAADGKGGSAKDSFTVTVKAAPVVASAIADVSRLDDGATRELSLSGVFSDADGDNLTITAASSNDAIATVSVSAGYSNLTVSGKAEGTTTISVTARDSDGSSVSDAFDVTVVKVAELPGPVVFLDLTATYDSVTVRWSAPETGGAPQGYIVHIKRKGGGYQDTLRPGADRTTVSFGNLDSGRTYEVWVRGQNEVGKGERTHASITLPESEDSLPSVLPGPVAGLELMADGNTLTVSWSAPETGGAPDGYIVHVSPEDGGKGKTKTPKAMKTQVTFKNLEAGQTYKVWVRAQNEAGKGERVHGSITLPEEEGGPTGQ